MSTIPITSSYDNASLVTFTRVSLIPIPKVWLGSSALSAPWWSMNLLPLEVSIQGHGYGLGIAIRVAHHLCNSTKLDHSSGCKKLSHNWTNCHLIRALSLWTIQASLDDGEVPHPKYPIPTLICKAHGCMCNERCIDLNYSSFGILGQSEPAPTSTPWRMNDKWSGNNFLLGSSSLANHGGYLSCFFLFFSPTYLPTNNPQAGY